VDRHESRRDLPVRLVAPCHGVPTSTRGSTPLRGGTASPTLGGGAAAEGRVRWARRRCTRGRCCAGAESGTRRSNLRLAASPRRHAAWRGRTRTSARRRPECSGSGTLRCSCNRTPTEPAPRSAAMPYARPCWRAIRRPSAGWRKTRERLRPCRGTVPRCRTARCSRAPQPRSDVERRKIDRQDRPPSASSGRGQREQCRDAPGSWSSGQVDLPTRKEHSNGYQHW